MNFFNQPYLADKIELGATLAVFGKWDRAKASLTGMKVLAQVEDDLNLFIDWLKESVRLVWSKSSKRPLIRG